MYANNNQIVFVFEQTPTVFVALMEIKRYKNTIRIRTVQSWDMSELSLAFPTPSPHMYHSKTLYTHQPFYTTFT